MNTDDEEETELGRWVRIMNSRGNAGMFGRENRGDLEIIEKQTAEEWRKSVEEKYKVKISHISPNPSDPPDCFAEYNKQTISIELTELVDGKLLEAIKADAKRGGEKPDISGRSMSEVLWTEERFNEEVLSILNKKHDKYKKRGILVDVLIIYTDERYLLPNDVQGWLSKIKFDRRTSFRNVFFLMTYHPSFSSNWPVFKLYGTLFN